MFQTGAGLATEEPDAVSFGRACTGSTISLGVLFPYFACNGVRLILISNTMFGDLRFHFMKIQDAPAFRVYEGLAALPN
ncbi:hypothetical protein HDF14_005164 [Edaphobacter lichenicola]|jgi:hypothetical protein|uniref:Uncharacterized protein n=1 Tax=Tunturiibacter gelidiferens TaxID=3069689 RepID=A0A9X0QJA6_9BACT|nr:hypothetical protein [Edaphobacter lichenicola]